MGPTNVALVKLFRADQALRDAQERLDVATKNVRVQERRCNDLAERQRLAQAKHRELQARSGNLDLDMRSRDAQLDKLREQQQGAKNTKEYQSLLVEINTRKVDRAKVEEEAMKVLEESETTGTESAALATSLEGERAKLAELKTQIGDTITQLQAEIASLQGPRDALATVLPPKARTAFDKLADHHEGEALSALLKPDRRKEEYACSTCMMGLVTDVYNKLHARDELVFCPSCRRILYIPDDLPPEMAVNNKKVVTRSSTAASKSKSSAGGKAAAAEPARSPEPPRAKGRLGEVLAAAQGESVKNAVDADQRPQEFHVTVDGRVIGEYKGKSADNLERIIRFRLDEAGLKHEVQLNPVVEAAADPVTPELAAVGTDGPSPVVEPAPAG